jgi:Na+-translocating ferredoxin:NAD+ oxidoreductase RnfG subunit
MGTANWVWLPVAAISTSVYATTYLSVEQAQELIFPGAKLAPAFVTLTDAQRKQVAQVSGVNAPSAEIRAWRVASGGFFIVDAVVGKHELITYALGLSADGSVKQVEILDYRESYGYEIRNQNWRRQFVGKGVGDPLRLDQDINNISGATLSCRHVTDGVRRLLAVYDAVLKGK